MFNETGSSGKRRVHGRYRGGQPMGLQLRGLGDLAGCGCESGNNSGSPGMDFSSISTFVWIGLAAFGALMVLKKR